VNNMPTMPRLLSLLSPTLLSPTLLSIVLAATVAGCAPAEAPASSSRAPAPDGPARVDTAAPDGETYAEDDVIAAAEGAFGQGAEGLAKAIERVFAEQGRPNAYIVGREAGGALIAGVRYGSGTLFHAVEGQRPVYWTGPSLGVDVGGDASKTFTLVYNLYDTEDLYGHRIAAVEGKAYVVGGLSVSYHRRGPLVIVPIRLGVGWRLGANIGYLLYTKESRLLPL
jgi:hypothetical protein